MKYLGVFHQSVKEFFKGIFANAQSSETILRRGKMQNYSSMILIIGAIITLFLLGIIPQTDPQSQKMALAVGFIFIVFGITYWLNRQGFSKVSGVLIWVAMVVAVNISDAPLEITDGRTTLSFFIPILIAGFVTPPWHSILAATFSSVSIVIHTGLQGIHELNYPAIIMFYVFAILVAMIATNLEQAIIRLNSSNEAKEKLMSRITVLSRSVVSTQEEERKRIAREVHDEIGQKLTALRMSIGVISEEEDEVFGQKKSEIYQQIDSISSELRKLSRNLGTKILEDFGLVEAVNSLVSDLAHQDAISLDFAYSGFVTEERFSKEIEIAAYRIIQESFNNILKHANPSKILIRLTYLDGFLLIIVADDGKGISSGETTRELKGLGLLSMEERARLVGGTMKIATGNKGTEVSAELPGEKV